MSNTSLKQPIVSISTKVSAKQPWRRWLLAFDGYNTSTNLAFASAIWVIYLATHGYSAFAIGLLEMLFHIAKFVAEVPTGIFADLMGRRKSLIVYSVLGAIQQLLFLAPALLPCIIASFVLSGIAYAFRGGAEEAVLWTLAGYADPDQQAARYSKLVSRMFMLGMLAELVGTTVGGYLGSILQILPFICQAIMSLIAIVPLLLIPEQKAISNQQEHINPLRHFGAGIRAVWQNPTLMGLLLISGLIEGGGTTIYFFYQLDLHGLGFSLAAIGLIVAVGKGTNFLFTALAPRTMRALPQRWLVPTFFLAQILSLLLMSMQQPALSLLGYLVFSQAANAILTPALSTYINGHSPEQQRATVLSLQTGLFSATMIVLFPLFGLGVSHVSYSIVYLWTLAALISGSLIILGGVWTIKRFRRKEV